MPNSLPTAVIKANSNYSLSNGILLRSDLNRLFDRGYLTIEPTTIKVLVSKRIREEFENGRDYYDLEDRLVQKPVDANAMRQWKSYAITMKKFSKDRVYDLTVMPCYSLIEKNLSHRCERASKMRRLG